MAVVLVIVTSHRALPTEMPPKKITNVAEDELEEIRKSLNSMWEGLSKVA